MQFARVTQTNPSQLITLEEAKQHGYVDDTAQDGMLPVYIGSAVEWFEAYTHRALGQQQWRLTLQDFPHNARASPKHPVGSFRLPFGRCSSIDGIQYVDNDGVTQTLAGPSSSPVGTDWQELLDSDEGAVLAPPYNADWPAVRDNTLNALQITFTVGYLASKIPERMKYAVLFQLVSQYEQRGEDDVKSSSLTAAERMALPYVLRRYTWPV